MAQQEDFTQELYKDKIYENAGNPDVIAQIPEGAQKILDVGCGAGDNARLLKLKGKHVTGLTVSETEATLAASICDEVIIANLESTSFQLQEVYDAIIVSHVCEHLVNPSAVLQKLAQFLAPNGVMIIAVPNMAFYRDRWKLLKGDWEMQEYGPFDKTHLHFYNYHTADQLLGQFQKAVYKKLPGGLAVPLWPLRKVFPGLSARIDRIVGRRFPNSFAQQTILVVKTPQQ